MRFLSILPALLLTFHPVANAAAGPVFDRVIAGKVVCCGGVERPGLALPDGRGLYEGLEVDVCRAVAAAVLGSPDRVKFHAYESPEDFDAVRKGADDLFFLTGAEIESNRVAGKVLPGPTVFVESQNVMVSSRSAARHVGDLAGESVCFMGGTPAEQCLNGCFAGLHKNFFRRSFTEDGEMVDAYQVGNCRGLAGEITYLAAARLDPGVNRISGRILPESLCAFPVMAATPASDAKWSAVVAWTLETLINAERPQTRWTNSGAAAMVVEAPELGLVKGWQDRVLKAVGSYRDIFERDLGKGSPFKLERGFNANQANGGLLLGPFVP